MKGAGDMLLVVTVVGVVLVLTVFLPALLPWRCAL